MGIVDGERERASEAATPPLPQASESLEEGQVQSDDVEEVQTQPKSFGFSMKKSSSKSKVVPKIFKDDEPTDNVYTKKSDLSLGAKKTSEEIEALIPTDQDALFAYEIDWEIARKVSLQFLFYSNITFPMINR